MPQAMSAIGSLSFGAIVGATTRGTNGTPAGDGMRACGTPPGDKMGVASAGVK